MRIAIFSETFLPKWDGVANTVSHLLEHLANRGHQSLMFAPEGAPERYAATPIRGLPSLAFPLYPDLRLVPPVFNVERELRAFAPDLVHVVNPAFLGLVGLRQARALGLPLAASYHTDLPGYTTTYGVGLLKETVWSYFRWLHNQAALNLAPSHFTKRQLEAHGFQRVKVWSHGVDTERFHPRHRSAAWRRRLTGGHPDAPLLLYVGRLAPEKRLDWLRPLLDGLPGTRLALVGDGPIRTELETLFAGSPTVFTGYLQGEELSHAYASADLFVFPSDSETFGNVVLEAMASGLPVIAAGAGGPVDLVQDGYNGYLFEASRQEALLILTRRYLSDARATQRLARNARTYAETQRWDVVNDLLLDDYQLLINGEDTSHLPAPTRGSRVRRESPRYPRRLWFD
jgi:glycosyltransferase involved in cell wall biosynthesis